MARSPRQDDRGDDSSRAGVTNTYSTVAAVAEIEAYRRRNSNVVLAAATRVYSATYGPMLLEVKTDGGTATRMGRNLGRDHGARAGIEGASGTSRWLIYR